MPGAFDQAPAGGLSKNEYLEKPNCYGGDEA
jgi:hypothetical protein